MKKLLLLASVLYFSLATVTYHPDTKLTLRYPAFESGRVWDIYKYLDENKLDVPDFHYPPAHFWWLKAHYAVSRVLGGAGFDQWLGSGSAEASFDLNSWRYNFASKFPLLILGLMSGWLIYSIVGKKYKQNVAIVAAAIFLFNPVTFYSLIIMGQNDIVAIFFFLLGWRFYDRWILMVIFWGLAAGVKSYPLIWAVLFLSVSEKNMTKFGLKLSLTIFVYGIILLPWIGKKYFIEAVLNSGLSQRMLVSNIPIGFDKVVIIIPTLLTVLILRASSLKRLLINKASVLFTTSLLILGFSHFNPQWMMWTVPFGAIMWATGGVRKSEMLAMLLCFSSWVTLTLGFDDRFLTWGLFSPINPNLINYPTLFGIASLRGIELGGLVNLAQSVLAGTSIWFMLRERHNSALKISLKLPRWIIILPWILILLLMSLLLLVKVDIKTLPKVTDRVVQVSELKERQNYKINDGVRYIEISLNNPGLMSKDKATLLIENEVGLTTEKEISGFNAGDRSWLRVDIPKEMKNSKELYLSVDKVVREDGQLTASIDDEGRWAIRQYSRGRPSAFDIFQKAINSAGVWIFCLMISWIYFVNDKKN